LIIWQYRQINSTRKYTLTDTVAGGNRWKQRQRGGSRDYNYDSRDYSCGSREFVDFSFFILFFI